MRCALFCDITQPEVVIPYQPFRTTCRSHLQVSRNLSISWCCVTSLKTADLTLIDLFCIQSLCSNYRYHEGSSSPSLGPVSLCPRCTSALGLLYSPKLSFSMDSITLCLLYRGKGPLLRLCLYLLARQSASQRRYSADEPMSRSQWRIKLFGAPRQWKHFRPLFQAVFLWGGERCITP